MSGSSSNSTIRMRGSSASFVQEAPDVKPLLVVEAEADVEMPYPTAAAVLQADPLSPPTSWKDPFYENDASVIAAFTFDYDRIDCGLVRTGLCLGGTSWLLLIIILCLPSYFIVLDVVLACFLVLYIALHFSDRSKQYRRRCMHIALTESAVYLDEVSEPGSRELMRRLQYKYFEIAKCGSRSNQTLRQCDVSSGLVRFQRWANVANRWVVGSAEICRCRE
jgi:hypothetical protein